MMTKIALVISMAALATCLLAGIAGILSDGLKGLKRNGKVIGAAFAVYAIAFVAYFVGQ